MSEIRRFYRSRRSRVLGGVLGGLAEYIDVDPNILRLIYLGLLILCLLLYPVFSLFLVVMYFLIWIFIPEKPVDIKGGAGEEYIQVDWQHMMGIIRFLALIIGFGFLVFGLFILLSVILMPIIIFIFRFLAQFDIKFLRAIAGIIFITIGIFLVITFRKSV